MKIYFHLNTINLKNGKAIHQIRPKTDHCVTTREFTGHAKGIGQFTAPKRAFGAQQPKTTTKNF